MTASNKALERFWSKVTKSPCGCWLYKGPFTFDGYGLFWDGKNRVRAHRFSMLLLGEIPAGKLVLHKCNVRSCVNPNHLYIGSHSENNADCLASGNFKRMSGETNGRSKLKETEVLEIKRKKPLGYTLKQLSEEYCVSISLVRKILSGERWAHVE